MKLKEEFDKNMRGIFDLKITDAITGKVLDRYVDTNIIVNDSRTAITRAISGLAGSYTIDTLKIGEDIGETMSGTPTVTFSNANPDTIVRSTGSWISDGFAVSDKITVRNTTFNDGEYTIDDITATKLTLSITDALTNEGPVGGIYITTGTQDAPASPLATYDATTMEVLYTAPSSPVAGYPDAQSVGFSITINGADFMSYYPLETSKIFTSAALHVTLGDLFAYKRFPKKSISSLVNITISWTLTY